MELESLFPVYPEISDTDFNKKIFNIKEFNDLFTGAYRLPNGNFVYQELAKRLMAPHTPFSRIVINFGTGTGKTRTVMNIVKDYSKIEGQKPAIFLMESPKNKAVVVSEYQKVFGAFAQKSKSDRGRGIAESKYMVHVKTRTYKELSNQIEKIGTETGQTREEFIEEYSNRIIIYDEVHNLKVENIMKGSKTKWDSALDEVLQEEDKSKERHTGKKTFDAIRKFSHILEGTGNIHLLLTATIMVNSPEEIASILDIAFPDLSDRIDSNTIKNFYELTKKKGTGIKTLLRKMREYLPDVDVDLFVSNVEEKNTIELSIDAERERAIQKNIDNKAQMDIMIARKKELDDGIEKVISLGLHNYLSPLLQGRVLKVSEIKKGPREIKMGKTYEIRGIDLDLYSVEMGPFQSLDYINNEMDTAGKAFKTKILESLIFTYPFVVKDRDGNTELCVDTDLLDGNTSDYVSARRAKEADIIDNKDGIVSLSMLGKRFFGDQEEGEENLRDCSAIFAEIINILRSKTDEQVFIKLTYLENIRILTALIKYLLEYDQFEGKGGKGKIGTLKAAPKDLIEEMKVSKGRKRAEIMNKLSGYDMPTNRIALITGGTSDAADQNIVSSFNMKDNIYGNYLRVIIGSRAAAESINFPYARNLIRISEWNPAKDIQVRGRVFRVDSQLLFPEDERYVNVYNMSPVFEGFETNPNQFSTAYTMMYAVSKQKAKNMDLIHKVIDDNSLTKYIDYSGKIKRDDIDVSGFISYYESSVLEETRKAMTLYFMSNSSFSIVSLLKRFPQIHHDILRQSLVKIQAENITFMNRFGQKCFLRNSGKRYFLQNSYDRSSASKYELQYCDAIYIHKGLSEISTLVQSYRNFAVSFLNEATLAEEFIEDFLKLDISEKVAVFETSFFIDFNPDIKAALYKITENLYYSFPEDKIIVHIMAKSINTNYKANVKKVNVSDQRMRGLRIDKDFDWYDISDTDAEGYADTITKILKNNYNKMNRYELYGLLSILDNSYRLCDTRGDTKLRKDGKTDQRTCKRGFICTEDKFFTVLPYLIELEVEPYDFNTAESPSYLLTKARETINSQDQSASDDMLLLWLHPENKKQACSLLFKKLDTMGRVIYK